MSVATELAALSALEDADRDPAVGPSDAAALQGGCWRRLAYRTQQYAPSDPEPEALLLAAEIGKAIHARVAAARRLAGWDLVETQVLVPGFPRPGVLDGYTVGRVDDVKSVSSRVYASILELGKARPQDAAQPELYALGLLHRARLSDDVTRAFEVPREMLGLCSLDVRTLSVTYVNRETGESFEDSWTFDPDVAEQTRLRMLEVIEAAARPPEDLGRAARDPSERPCSDCPFRSRCWGQNLEVAVPLEQPAPLEVARAAARYQELAARKRELERELDGLRPLVEAGAGATFTDSEGLERRIRLSAGRTPGDGGHLDQRRARELLARWGEEAPTLGTAPRLSFPVVK